MINVMQPTLGQEELDAIKKGQEDLMAEAFEKAWAVDFPSKEDCLDYNNLYSNNAGGEV